jgi:hypothetical protein
MPIADTQLRDGPLAPCIDHVVPINHPRNHKHGHTADNVQLAHRRCNEIKGASLASESLLSCDSPRAHVRALNIDQRSLRGSSPGVG